jgi:PAS domain S-box-containing protein
MIKKEQIKIITVGIMIVICLILTLYFHFVLKSEIIYSHLLYIPIVIASIYWKRAGIYVSIFLGMFIVLSQILSGIEFKLLEITRPLMFVAVAVVITFLNERNKKTLLEKEKVEKNETALKNKNEKLKEAKEKIEESERNLQIKNEEYEALNEELRQANEELLQINGELEVTKEKVEENEQKFRLMYENSSIGIAIVGLDFKFRAANKTFCEMLGYTEKEFIGKTIQDITHPEIIEENIELQKKLGQGNIQSFQLTKKFIHKDGHVVYGLLNSTVIRNKNNEALYFLGNVQDITTLKNTEQELIKAKEKVEESETFLLNIFENIPNMIFIKNADDLKFTHFNKAGEQLLGYTREELIGKNDYDFFTKEQADFFTSKDKAVFESNDLLIIEEETINTKYDVKILYTKKIAVKDKTGNNRYLLGISEDITKKKEIEKKLIEANEKTEESEQRLSAFINSIPDIICYKDGNGKWLLANDADLELFCLNGVDYFGKTDIELSEYTNEIYKNAFITCMETDEEAWNKKSISNGTEIIPTVSGCKKVYDIYKVPVFYQNGERKGLAVIGRDISKLHETQENLISAKEKAEENDRLKTAFLHNISHEIRTPMNAICGFSGLLDRPNTTEEKRKNFTKIIQNSSNQLLSIVTDIVTISTIETKQEKLNFKNTRINSILHEMLSIFQSQALNKNISLRLNQQLTDLQSVVYTDKTKISQILSNLLSNALKFTISGSIEFGYILKDLYLEFYVSDTGIGIKKEAHEKIFERFRQADETIHVNYGGTGLGLSIVKGYVELLGGKIWVQSEPDKGSTFYFTIPYKPTNEKDEAEKTNQLVKSLNYRTILIAEDEEYNYQLIEELLLDLNVKLIHAKDGRETVEIFKTNPKIDLILMDIKMPIMTGDEAAKIIKELNPNLPIVAQSAYALEHERAKYEVFFDDYITKPINKDELKQKILKYIEVPKKE